MTDLYETTATHLKIDVTQMFVSGFFIYYLVESHPSVYLFYSFSAFELITPTTRLNAVCRLYSQTQQLGFQSLKRERTPSRCPRCLAGFISIMRTPFSDILPLPLCCVIKRVSYPGAFWDVTTEERMTDTEQKNSSSCSSVAMVTFCGCVK